MEKTKEKFKIGEYVLIQKSFDSSSDIAFNPKKYIQIGQKAKIIDVADIGIINLVYRCELIDRSKKSLSWYWREECLVKLNCKYRKSK